MYNREYIDVRGHHPVYFVGMRSYRLVDSPRDITIEQARLLATE